ncbi:MAG: hypothetical protein UY52_C0018G0008 [Parcubacteria group bacterium GW2011_GWC2_49_9]|nr:MAG: hypothetical protein UY34_C0006G0019 [Parcubacteria group bacterium GW2011_GWA2_48_9]KKW15538.1 MAG: hypothetical protein UY52_C0018G0008 [Parcubacteria group bacterium GW2011_GWC2_49_9]
MTNFYHEGDQTDSSLSAFSYRESGPGKFNYIKKQRQMNRLNVFYL